MSDDGFEPDEQPHSEESNSLTGSQKPNNDDDYAAHFLAFNPKETDAPPPNESTTSSDNTKKRRRGRVRGSRLTSTRHTVLGMCFVVCQYPGKAEQANIAAYIGSTTSSVKVWFQNARSRYINDDGEIIIKPAVTYNGHTAKDIMAGAPRLFARESAPESPRVEMRDVATQHTTLPDELIAMYEHGVFERFLSFRGVENVGLGGPTIKKT